MPTPFPGMDPYLEQPALWPDVHNGLIAALRNVLVPQLRPRYYVALEERTYLSAPAGLTLVSRPDLTVVETLDSPTDPALQREALSSSVATLAPVSVELPIPERVHETYLEVRLAQTHEVITVLELLSPTSKRAGEGRQQYECKRFQVLATATHLVEIDLLRAGEPLPMFTRGQAVSASYRLLISRAEQRPRATLLPCTVRLPIPCFALPLQPGDVEPRVDLTSVLHQLYDQAGYDLRLDYCLDADPPLTGADAAWAYALLQAAGKR